MVLAIGAAATSALTSATNASTRCDLDSTTAVYTPRFAGDQQLSAPVSEILNLQIWTTLRKSAGPREFGCGSLYWDDFGADATSDEVRTRTPRDAALTYWGRVQKIANGVIILSSLERTEYAKVRPKEVWRIELNGRSIVLNPVRQSYSLSPIVLKDAIIKRYNSLPQLVFCVARVKDCKGSVIGHSDIVAATQEGEFARVRLKGRSGWIYLPKLADRSEVVSFIGGVVRMMRGDYAGAYDLLETTVGASNVSAALRVDALLLQATSLGIRGISVTEKINDARRLNPYARDILRVQFMQFCARAAMAARPDERASSLSKAEHLLAGAERLFSPDDEWLLSAKKFVR